MWLQLHCGWCVRSPQGHAVWIMAQPAGWSSGAASQVCPPSQRRCMILALCPYPSVTQWLCFCFSVHFHPLGASWQWLRTTHLATWNLELFIHTSLWDTTLSIKGCNSAAMVCFAWWRGWNLLGSQEFRSSCVVTRMELTPPLVCPHSRLQAPDAEHFVL